MRGAQPLHTLGVVDNGIDLQPVADNAGIGQQAGAVGIGEASDGINLKAGKGRVHAGAALQHDVPTQPGLHDLQAKPLEHHGFIPIGEAVFVGVIVCVHGVARGEGAIS